MTPAAPRWLLCRARQPHAALRLYCFPHSGGSPGEYLRWADGLPGIEVWAVQLPGRGSRISEHPHTKMTTLVDALVREASFTAPFVFFGHSLGALVAFETARALRDHGLPAPQHLYLSASAPGSAPVRGKPLHHLSDPDLAAAVERTWGPLPAEVHEDPDLLALVLAGLRPDLEIVHDYRFTPGEPLACPVSVLGGLEDEDDEQQLAQWRQHTTGRFDLRMFPGDHFYYRENHNAFLSDLAASLSECAERALPGAGALGSAQAVL